MHTLPNVLLVVALILTVADLIWPTARLTTVGLLLVIVALLAGTVLLPR